MLTILERSGYQVQDLISRHSEPRVHSLTREVQACSSSQFNGKGCRFKRTQSIVDL